MSSTADVPNGAAADNIRYRQHAKTSDDGDKAERLSLERDGNMKPDEEDERPKDNKTYGRTPGGRVFTVPQTHDMVSQLLDPRQPKNFSDVAVISIIIGHCVLAFLLPGNLKIPVFAIVFLFWRAAYNIGIGFLLKIQSNHLRLVSWARRWRLFEDPAKGKNPRPWLYQLLKSEFEAKIPADYSFDEAPIEYNTWLAFRRVVDLILMCDFTSYCLFAVVCAGTPEDESALQAIGRWSLGIALFAFNLWVKLDAHRVVKDYAWYWGDFFFLVDQELTFDGVFEMAPHPMYSIGYIGLYGISSMAASLQVLFISIFAHVAQLLFLVVVEEPHIQKTYNPPPPRKRAISRSAYDSEEVISDTQSWVAQPSTAPREAPPQVHKLLGLNNLDLFRTIDYAVVLLCAYLAALTLLTPSTPLYQFGFVLHAALWRLWYTVGLGVILKQQSNSKMWTRHFLKYGEDMGEAWRQWKGLHHVSMSMSYATLLAACWKLYSPPDDWSDSAVVLKHVFGAGLVALQMWTATSIYEELGEFGWFCGDFFFDHQAKLTYKSIYRFLNNPERILGTAGVWGAALITWSRAIFVMALLSQLLTLGFINYVEKPHMQKIYGNSLRREAGLTKFIKRNMPPPVKRVHDRVDNLIDGTSAFVEDFLNFARPKLASGVKTIMRDTTALFNSYPARLTITRIAEDMAGFEPKHYSLGIEGTPSSPSALSERITGKESLRARFPPDVKTMILEYGAPIKVKWTAPAHHSVKDWIGLYMVIDNHSREATEIPSLGRWAPTNRGRYDSTADKSILVAEHPAPRPDPSSPEMVAGEVIFEGDKLWWTQGVFEFRYHHDGHHNVMAISQPFEIRIGKFVDDDVDTQQFLDSTAPVYEKAVEEALLPVVRNCLDRDPDIAPSTIDEPFGAHVERDSKYARRVVYAIHQMFGIEFAPAVVPADGNVKKLAWRIFNAKQVLAPYSMSTSKGSSTPTSTSEFSIVED